MLQVSTGKYFRDVPLHKTEHRRILYTNANFIRCPAIDLSVATLLPSDESKSITTVTAEFVEQLEAVQPDGTRELMSSTGGESMLDDLACVLSFAFNATFSKDHDLVHRLIPADIGSRGARSSPARILRHTCDPGIFVNTEAIDDARRLIEQLMALNRKSYERVIRAIRQVVNACRRVADDPTLSYTMFVAALESLASGTTSDAAPWDAVDSRKRKLLDAALEGVDGLVADRVRSAVIEAERAGLKRRFKAFVIDNVTPAYFREDAVEAIRPPSAIELTKAIGRAYDVRSQNVHVLENLRPEALVFGERADLVNPAGRGLMLSLEGLNRLSRNVIREHIARAETVQDVPFDYRSALPNVLNGHLAPQYWIARPDGLTKDSVDRYFAGFVELLRETLRQPTSQPEGEGDRNDEPIDTNQMPDIGPILTRIEELTPGLSGKPRLPLIAIYVLWHRFFVIESHSPHAAAFISKYGAELEPPSMPSFVASCFTGDDPGWTLTEFRQLAEADLAARTERNPHPLPGIFYAALAAEIAERLAPDGQRRESLAMLSRAIEECPGNTELMEIEADYAAGGQLSVDIRALVIGADKARTDGSQE